MESHYVRENRKRQFLSSILNIHLMYELYKGDKDDALEKVGEETYRNIFNTSFNLSFHKPKKDRCDVCMEFENSTIQLIDLTIIIVNNF